VLWVFKVSFDRENVMSLKRTIGSVFVVSCLSIPPCANAALEIAAHKASTSTTLAHTAANAWALETDPAISNAPGEDTPPLMDYFYLGGNLQNTYDPSQFTLNTDPNGYPTLQTSVSGLGDYLVTGFTVDYFANPNGFKDPGGVSDTYQGTDGVPEYPSITVTAASLTLNPDADGNLPDINLPVGEVDDITFELNSVVEDGLINSADDQGEPNVTVDQFFFQLNLTGSVNPTIIPSLYTSSGGQNGLLTYFDPDLNPNDPNYLMTTVNPNINPSQIPEPASISLLAISGVGLLGRRRSR
jgi:hypothetical protein